MSKWIAVLIMPPRRREVGTTQRLGDDPRGPGFRWTVGVAVPLAILAYGISILVTRHATLGRHGTLTLTGRNAIAIGIGWIAVGFLVHITYFWDALFEDHGWVEIAKIISLAVAVGGLGFVLVRLGVFGMR